MKSNRFSLLLLSLSLSTAVFASTAQASGPAGTAADFGSTAPESAQTKVIDLSAPTKNVNVTDGDTVRFVQGNTSFTWHFEIFPGRDEFKLSRIAPAAMHVDGVEVFVAANSLYVD